MKAIVQRVNRAELRIEKEGNSEVKAKIGKGLVVYLGIEVNDEDTDLYFLCQKIANLRIFEDDKGKLMYSVRDKGLEIMCIPNFTLAASTDKGNRPSFDKSASKDKAEEYFERFCDKLSESGIRCQKGIFGAFMIIDAESFGPVNMIFDSRKI